MAKACGCDKLFCLDHARQQKLLQSLYAHIQVRNLAPNKLETLHDIKIKVTVSTKHLIY